ncbi:MAG: GyrI-like domain-containing protein [Oscillospiraceae bacterium]
MFQWALENAGKKPEVDCSKIRLEAFEEGLCVQMMHLGPYSEEETTLSQLREWIGAQGYRDDTGESRRHHELYLSDPRRCAPQRMKTVLRLPISRP